MPNTDVLLRFISAWSCVAVKAGCNAGGSYRITADATAGAVQREMPDSARRRAASDSGAPSLDQDRVSQQHSSKAFVAPAVEARAADALSVQGHGYKAAEGPAAKDAKPGESAAGCAQAEMQTEPDVHHGKGEEKGAVHDAGSTAKAATSSQIVGAVPDTKSLIVTVTLASRM